MFPLGHWLLPASIIPRSPSPDKASPRGSSAEIDLSPAVSCRLGRASRCFAAGARGGDHIDSQLKAMIGFRCDLFYTFRQRDDSCRRCGLESWATGSCSKQNQKRYTTPTSIQCHGNVIEMTGFKPCQRPSLPTLLRATAFLCASVRHTTRATPRAHKEPAGSLPSRLMSDSQGRN
jgi:hypothetical protein